MKLSYFPGCTLKNKAKDLDIYARRSAEALGITLEEIPFEETRSYVKKVQLVQKVYQYIYHQ